LKNARRVTVDSNIFEYCWKDGQEGYAILLTPRSELTSAWAGVMDVIFTRNVVRHSAMGIQMLSADDNIPSAGLHRITFRDNVLDDINGTVWGSNGRMTLFNASAFGPGSGFVIDHNTILHGSTGGNSFATGTGNLFADRLIYTNNLVTHGNFGFFDGVEGTGAMQVLFTTFTFVRNGIIGGGRASLYPANNFFPADLAAVRFMDPVTGDYRLRADSPYHNAALDGKDLGADVAMVQSATCGVRAGIPTSACGTLPIVTATCDLNHDSSTNISDVQLMVNQALGLVSCTNDLNRDALCNIVDVQRVISSALGNPCLNS
jgi:hypothetical protein